MKDNDISVFPHPLNPGDFGRGMSLRDYFAAAALNGSLSCAVDIDPKGNPDKWAKFAYAMADAMLVERAK